LGVKVDGSLESALRDGVLLSKVLNKLKDNAVQFKEAKDEATAKSNLQNFTNASRALGIFTFRPADLLNGDRVHLVLRTVEGLKAHAIKNGKYKAVKVLRAPLSVSRALASRRVPRQAKQGDAKKKNKGKKKAEAAAPKRRGKLESEGATNFVYNFKPQPVINRPKPVIVRESYLSNLQTEAIPDTFLQKLMSEETLHHGLVVIGFIHGLELIAAGKPYIIPPRGSKSHKTIAFNFLEFLGYKLIPTTKQAGGHLVEADASRVTLSKRLLTLFAPANKAALGIRPAKAAKAAKPSTAQKK